MAARSCSRRDENVKEILQEVWASESIHLKLSRMHRNGYIYGEISH